MDKPLNLKPNMPSSAILTNSIKNAPWRILIVDDDLEIHAVTRFILSDFLFQERELELLSAYSGAEAKELLEVEKDIAVILLDVVMETDDAGLRLVHTIRNDFNNKAVRIILRTGQPGQAPEERIIVDYDINDYKAKSELTTQKLFTTLIASLRSYKTIVSLERKTLELEHNRIGLGKILASSDSLFQINSMREFASGVLMQLCAFLDCQPEGILCINDNYGADFSYENCVEKMEVIAAAGKYEDFLKNHEHISVKQCHDIELEKCMREAIKTKKNYFNNHFTVLYLESNVHKAVIAIARSCTMIDVHDQKLLEVFISKISIALSNVIHYQKMISAEEAATIDYLTGLNNRRELIRQSQLLIATAKRNGTPLSCAMLDIDFFKKVNDTYGHDAGDVVLMEVGKLLKERFRSSDIVARYGGEEFCILVPQLDEKQTFELFNNFRQILAEKIIKTAGIELKTTVSIGVTTILCAEVDNMISHADELLYQAKENGRNRVVIA